MMKLTAEDVSEPGASSVVGLSKIQFLAQTQGSFVDRLGRRTWRIKAIGQRTLPASTMTRNAYNHQWKSCSMRYMFSTS